MTNAETETRTTPYDVYRAQAGKINNELALFDEVRRLNGVTLVSGNRLTSHLGDTSELDEALSSFQHIAHPKYFLITENGRHLVVGQDSTAQHADLHWTMNRQIFNDTYYSGGKAINLVSGVCFSVVGLNDHTFARVDKIKEDWNITPAFVGRLQHKEGFIVVDARGEEMRIPKPPSMESNR